MLNIPHLTTSRRALSTLERKMLDNQINIEDWFSQYWQNTPPILTSSVDLRNAGFKISVVDTNLFPAGFNNLNPDFFPLCEAAIKKTMNQYYPNCQRVLIIAENHTRNPHYYESIAIFSHFFEKAGFEVKISQLLEDHTFSPKVDNELKIYPIDREANLLILPDFIPCLVVLNNDLSSGVPALLEGIKQNIEPPPQLGWSFRRKSTHFKYYREICEEFATIMDIDPWLISPLFLECDNINFMEREGLESLKDKTELLLNAIQKKYDEYDIHNKPYVVVKADAGTYGMAVMAIHNPKEYENLNRKQRMSMSKSKGGNNVTQVIIQEGVPTIEKIGINQFVAEPVVYMLGQYVIGGFYRVHPKRETNENLNSPGMIFEKCQFDACCKKEEDRLTPHTSQNQFYAYSVLARLGLLASAKEKCALTSTKDSKK